MDVEFTLKGGAIRKLLDLAINSGDPDLREAVDVLDEIQGAVINRDVTVLVTRFKLD